MERIEECIYRKDNGKLQVKTSANDPYTGKLRWKKHTMPAGATLAEAREMIDVLKAEITGRRSHAQPNVRTVEDYATWWLKQKVNDLAPKTRKNYLLALERLVEHMGGLAISDVVRADLQDWVSWAESLRRPVPPERWLSPDVDSTDDLSDARTRIVEHLQEHGETELRQLVRGARTTRKTIGRMLDADELKERVVELPPEPYAEDSLRSWWRIILIVMRDAVADGFIDADPTTRVRPPSSSTRNVQEKKTLSARELGDLVAAVRRQSPGRYAEVVTLAYTGMRAGELYGLMWDDIDWANERIHIRRSTSDRELRAETKTKAPRETYMPKIVADAIREHHERRMRDDDLHELVFPADSGEVRASDTLRRVFDAAAVEAGIDINVGALVLRRTFDTLMVTAGVDRIVLRSMIGHSSEEMTERYAGVRLEDKRAAVLSIVPTTPNTEKA